MSPLTPEALDMIRDRAGALRAARRQQAMSTAAMLMRDFPGAEVRTVPIGPDGAPGLEALLPGKRVTGDAGEVREWLAANHVVRSARPSR